MRRKGWQYICLTCVRCNMSSINSTSTKVVAIFQIRIASTYKYKQGDTRYIDRKIIRFSLARTTRSFHCIRNTEYRANAALSIVDQQDEHEITLSHISSTFSSQWKPKNLLSACKYLSPSLSPPGCNKDRNILALPFFACPTFVMCYKWAINVVNLSSRTDMFCRNFSLVWQMRKILWCIVNCADIISFWL